MLVGALGDDDFTRVTQTNDCELSADGLYCVSWQASPGAGYESFFGLTVGDMPAVVTHSAFRVNSPDGWNVTWYDATVDATYQFSAYLCDEDCGALDLAARLDGSRDITPDNRAAAEALTQFAATFVEVRL
jgi:hypothetical protein